MTTNKKLKQLQNECINLRRRLDSKILEWHREHDKLDDKTVNHELDSASFDFDMYPTHLRRLFD